MLGAASALAADEKDPILDPSVVPYLSAGDRHDYLRFLDVDLPCAFAVSSDGHHAFAARVRGSERATRQRALFYCRAAGGRDCKLYAVGLDVVWPGLAWTAKLPPDTVGDPTLRPDSDYLWHAPPASGVFIWLGNLPPPPFARLYNNAGFDVVLATSTDRLAALRDAGFTRVVLGGYADSATAALAASPAADAVIALSPGVVRPIPAAPRTRVAVILFDGSPGDSDAVRRAALDAKPTLGDLLLMQPDGFPGADSGLAVSFTGYFGECLLRFGASDRPPSAC